MHHFYGDTVDYTGQVVRLLYFLLMFAYLQTGKHDFPQELRRFPNPNSQEKNMSIGTVKWFNATKGYGFIEPEDKTNDVFVHISAVQASGMTELKEGQQVSYDLEEQRNGKTAAVNLKAQ